MKRFFLLTLAAALLTSCHQHFGDFQHPGVMHGSQELALVRSKIETRQEPWATAWKKVQDSRYLESDWQPKPQARVERGPYNKPDIGSSEFTQDGRAAYTHALNWALTGNEKSARKAAEILDAWSSTLEIITNHDARLLIGMSGLPYIVTAELLAHTWDGWSPEGQQDFEKMLREIWYPIIKDFYPSANGNWDASMMQTMIAMGVYLDDHAIFNRAVLYYRMGKGNGRVRNYFKNSGQCQESGRDQAHTQMGLEFLVNTCETAWLQGHNLYGASNNLLLKGFEYTAKYNLGNDVPYEPYRSYQGRYHYKKLSKKARGRIRPMYEKPLNHYHHRKGLTTPFTEQAALKSRERSGRRSSLPWSTLMFSQ